MKVRILYKEKMPNKSFNLINPLSWFVQKSHAQTTPSLRSSSGADLKVKPMLEGLANLKKSYIGDVDESFY